MSQLQKYRHKALPVRRQSVTPLPLPQETVIENESLNIVSFVRVLRRRKNLVVLAVMAGLIVAAAVSMAQRKIYRAETVLEVQEMNENFLDLKDIQPTQTAASHLDDSYLHTQAEMLEQSALIERVVHKMQLGAADSEFVSPSARTPEQRLQSAVEGVKKNLRVTPSRQSRILTLSFQSRDPKLAADLSNSLAETYIEQSIEARWNAAQQIREWLRPQVEELRVKLETAEHELQEYSRRSGVMVTSEQETLAEDRLRSVQGELTKAQADRIAKEPLVEMAQSGGEAGLEDNPLIREHELRLSDLRRQLADVGSVLTPENYRVQRLQAQISELESTLQQETAKSRNRVVESYDAAKRREKLLSAAYSEQSARVSDLTAKMVHYNTLKQQVETTRSLYEAMLRKANEAGVASAIRPSNIRIVTPAVPPLRPFRPNIPLNMSIGLLGGLCAGIGFLLIVEQMPNRIRMPGDVSLHLRVPELGAVPAARVAGSTRTLLKSAQGPEDKSVLTEAFRIVGASILALGRSRTPPQVLVITSPLSGEGKTTVVTNLGIALAEMGSTVLLIDADMRRPRLHQTFRIVNSWGLSDVLSERNDVLQLPLDVLVKPTDVDNLFLLPSGPPVDNIARLLYSRRLQQLLARFSKEFDYVLVDCPPSLQFADARILGQSADGALMVIRADHTERNIALQALQQFAMDDIPVLGTVLNGWDPRYAPTHKPPMYGAVTRVDVA
jgi:capsular exopolysaccharide synthesis family protein